MSRREELEKEYSLVDERINNAAEDTPRDVIDAWRKELDSIDFELNNLYDDDMDDDN